MRIGLVLSSSPAYSETFFTSKINGLANHGHTVYLFASGKPNPALQCRQISPFPVLDSSVLNAILVAVVSLITFLRVPKTVIRFLREEQLDKISVGDRIKKFYLSAHILPHAVDWLHFGFATMALGKENVARAMGAKMGVSLRGYDVDVYPLKFPGCYSRLWQRVDKVHALSQYLIGQAYTLGLSRSTPITMITPALSFLPEVQDREVHQSLTILTVARLQWIKGLEYAVQAAALLKNKGVAFTYSIVGEGLEYEKLLFEIHRLGVAGEVKLVGKKTHQETLDLMKACDVYVQPSLSEGFCNATLEAQALGCLCIASDAGALPENVIDNETGWLVRPRSAEALAETIWTVTTLSPEKQSTVRRDAQKRTIEKFNGKRQAELWVDFFDSMNTK